MQNRSIGISFPSSEEPSLAPVMTFVIWVGCVLIGVLGFALPYLRPAGIVSVEPLRLEVLNIELTDAAVQPENPVVQTDPVPDATTPPPPDVFVPPVPAELVAVAQPSPAVVFALPVEGPVRIVDAARADYAVRASEAAAETAGTIAVPAPAPRQLSFGQGEGRRLRRPEYPIRARREGQEGTIIVRFVVGENRRVLSVQIVSQSWPLLNEATERAARNHWHGVLEPGLYEMSVQFQLSR